MYIRKQRKSFLVLRSVYRPGSKGPEQEYFGSFSQDDDEIPAKIINQLDPDECQSLIESFNALKLKQRIETAKVELEGFPAKLIKLDQLIELTQPSAEWKAEMIAALDLAKAKIS